MPKPTLILAAFLAACSCCGVSHATPNVLLIAVDDLRPELGCYGADHIHSPNIDRFAERALLFERAYCQQAVCNPSRTSLMTGLRPDTIGVTGNHTHFRDKHPDVVTLPQHFKNHGYHAQSIGKIYHGVFLEGSSRTVWDTMGDPPSWSVPTTRFGPRYYYTEDGIRQARESYLATYRPKDPAPDDWTTKLVFGPMTEAPDVPDETLYDGQVAAAAVDTLRQLGDADQPFFLAVGFIKPHTPFVAPKKYWDLYDPETIKLSDDHDLPDGAPVYAGHYSGEVRRYTDQPNNGPFSEDDQRRLRHGYQACISFTDAQVGHVLDELDRLGLADDTIVVLYGDHGWHLGEHGLWGKTTNFELDTRAPLIVHAPGMKAAGKRTKALVEFVDIYPTLAKLADLPAREELQGKSFAPLLNDSALPWKPAAYSQYPRGKRTGYSMRTPRYRYTEWIDRHSGMTDVRELYDYQADPAETVSVAEQSEHSALIARLSEQLHESLDLPVMDAQGRFADPRPVTGERVVIVDNGQAKKGHAEGWKPRDGCLEGAGKTPRPIMTFALAQGDFHIKARLRMLDQKGSAASFFLDGNHFGFEGNRETLYLNGPIFGELKLLAKTTDVYPRGEWIDFEAVRNSQTLFFRINGRTIHKVDDGGRRYERVGFSPWRSTTQVSDFSVVGNLEEPPKPVPYTDVFVQGKDQYPRIRIPAIVTTNRGTLLAFAEGRQAGDHSENDIIMKRSLDGGQTWGPVQVLDDDGPLALNNPQPVVLPDSGRVLLIYQRNKHGERTALPGYEGEDVGYTLLIFSDDDGQTWSEPRDITRGVKRPAPVTSHAAGPGVGIVLRRGEHQGRIIMPYNQGPFGQWKVYAAYSDDEGETWTYGKTAPDDETGLGNEVQMVELADGTVMLNSRTQDGTKHRKVAFSRDGGETWSPLRDDPTLIEPQCQGTILRYSDPLDGKRSRILFANPASQSGRQNGMIRLSYDEGKTWPVGKVVCPGSFAYSCLTVLPDGAIGLLYERDGYRAISFCKVTLDWLTDGKDKGD
jgi:iduronate 2-sulfatase